MRLRIVFAVAIGVFRRGGYKSSDPPRRNAERAEAGLLVSPPSLEPEEASERAAAIGSGPGRRPVPGHWPAGFRWRCP
jgi:hypothetical protein